MSGVNRLPAPSGLLVDHEKKIEFTFEGHRYEGLAGDCIASALAASDQWLLSRSFKYHRPRGVLTMAGQDANSLVQLPADPNVLADREPIREGLKVQGQNYKGSLERDRHAWIGRFSKFLPVGFYYKAFYRPAGIWEKWALMFRKRTGLGRVDTAFKPGYFDKQYLFCDIAVIGAGPAGMQAALEAAATGADVLLIEENRALGGSLTYARFDADGQLADSLRSELIAAIENEPRISVMTETVCNAWFTDNWLPLIKGSRMYKLRSRQVIACVGALEQQAVFRNNDLPGIMFGSAAQRLIKLYGVRPGTSAVVLTGNNDGYAVALDLADAGVQVSAIVELRCRPQLDTIARAAVSRGIKVIEGQAVYEAIPRTDGSHIAAVEVRATKGRGAWGDSGSRIECDLLCTSVGFTPTYQLPCHAGGRLVYDEVRAFFNIENLPAGLHLAGSVQGCWELEEVRDQGRHMARVAAAELDLLQVDAQTQMEEKRSSGPNFDWPIFPHPKGKEFVDFDEDLQIADIVNATRDGYEDIQLVKRYSTLGMGPSQGRNAALAGARLAASATGRSVTETGVTTARPPFAPERLSHLAGRSFYPVRYTSMHHRHLEAGAQMLIAGVWMRPAFYGPADARERCMREESLNVHSNVGLVDVSTLGGLEVRGPDAGEFLNRICTFAFVKQAVGRSRYVVMTNEAGVVIDDGVACRLHEELYYVTATTGGVDRVYQSMLRWNAQWRLDVDVANVTAGWCGVNIAGPKSRAVLARLCTDVDLSAEAFPYMGVREGTVASIPARLLRVGFVGELGFEIHVPQHFGEALWDGLLEAGRDDGIKPFGIEAQRLLRLEKGHIIIGQDTDAMAHPGEVHLSWAVSRKKPFFVGGRTITEIDKYPLTRKLAGFVINDPGAPIPEESHLVLQDDRMTGRVTSCYFSPILNKPIGMAFMTPDQAEPGNTVTIRVADGKLVSAEVVSMPFYDPENKRQEM